MDKMYWFSGSNDSLRYDDNRIAKVGITHEVEGDLKLCKNGLHASPSIFDALQYAPGCILWEVELIGEVLSEHDKSCSNKRKYLSRLDITTVLQEFARKQALINIENIKPYVTIDNYEIIVKFLETGDESLMDVAADAAYATRYAAWYAANAADAARYATDAANAANAADVARYATDAAYAANVAANAANVAANAANAARNASIMLDKMINIYRKSIQ